MLNFIGAVFTSEAQKSLEEEPSSFEVLDTDIPELKPVVKQMNISLLSSAIAISMQAKQQSADRLFRYLISSSSFSLLTLKSSFPSGPFFSSPFLIFFDISLFFH